MRSPKRPTAYARWSRGQGIDVVPGFHIPDLRALPLKPWARVGGEGVFINHDDSDRSNDCYVSRIPAGGSLHPVRHLHEVMIHVLSGRGSTTVWGPGGEPRSFEWGTGSLFAIPLNLRYQHFNGSGEQPATLLAVTNAPVVINLFDEAEFVFDCPYDFTARYSGAAGYFGGEGTLTGRLWESNFVPDVREFGLVDYRERGAGGTNVQFRLARNTMMAHVSQFPVGTYKKAHRHAPGAHVVILGGTGYSLMWKEGEPVERFDWSAGSLVVPPGDTFHQHFNTGPAPARYLALRHLNARRDPATGLPMSSVSTRLGGDQIDYADESPAVREMYREACADNGVEPRMAEFHGTARNTVRNRA
ncbi:ethanolamine ammonia lyase-activating protein [Streptomyces sp. NBC_01498]|uniref:ethanolamine ammonia lyase-activating protein n=1 Tax=Streptomyces sp. NBC_01498 TaxID=2975870 RepID=UPI002E7AE82F|nr:ethanolamine ammonia lyase-activating protein [Streptomyces sp. NBC_01498]WTL28000.1 ethanolamine ammonia lyase-activating protein [Streptomyces sp. NBC_01498]